MEEGWTISQLIYGLIVCVIGFVLVWKSDWFLKNFGRVPSAEKYLGSEGGTRLFYKLLGVLVMIGGIMYGLDMLEPLGNWIWKTFFT